MKLVKLLPQCIDQINLTSLLSDTHKFFCDNGATTQAGVRFTAGIDLSSRYFTEVNYDYVGDFTEYLGNGVRTDGLSFLVGARF